MSSDGSLSSFYRPAASETVTFKGTFKICLKVPLTSSDRPHVKSLLFERLLSLFRSTNRRRAMTVFEDRLFKHERLPLTFVWVCSSRVLALNESLFYFLQVTFVAVLLVLTVHTVIFLCWSVCQSVLCLSSEGFYHFFLHYRRFLRSESRL